MRLSVVIVFCFSALALYAQSVEPAVFDYESDYYQIHSYVSREHAREIGTRLDAYIRHFYQLFRFTLDELDYKLRVRIFRFQDDYLSYLVPFIGEPVRGETRQNYVYLHNNNPAQSELVGVMGEDNALGRSFTHQSFIQVLRAFVHNPPLWLREGFAIHFENIQYDQGIIEHDGNLSWLETLKDILLNDRRDEALSLRSLLFIDLDAARENIDVFYPQSWGIVHFLMNTDIRDYNRIIWDAIHSLSADVSLQENSRVVYDNTFQWINTDEFMHSMREFYNGIKTRTEFIEAGVSDYEQGAFESAAENFMRAIDRQDDSYIPYYYLGLMQYDQQNYDAAESYYMQAVTKGQQDALVYYALGVNAFADNEFEKALVYFDTADSFDSGEFAQRIREIRSRIES